MTSMQHPTSSSIVDGCQHCCLVLWTQTAIISFFTSPWRPGVQQYTTCLTGISALKFQTRSELMTVDEEPAGRTHTYRMYVLQSRMLTAKQPSAAEVGVPLQCHVI